MALVVHDEIRASDIRKKILSSSLFKNDQPEVVVPKPGMGGQVRRPQIGKISWENQQQKPAGDGAVVPLYTNAARVDIPEPAKLGNITPFPDFGWEASRPIDRIDLGVRPRAGHSFVMEKRENRGLKKDLLKGHREGMVRDAVGFRQKFVIAN
jgi:hypothetical protein